MPLLTLVRTVLRRLALLLLAPAAVSFLLLLSGCGGGGDPPATPPARGPDRATTPVQMQGAAYLSTGQVDLDTIDQQLRHADDLQMRQTEGPAMEFALHGKQVLYHLSPAEQYQPTDSVLELRSDALQRAYRLRFPWHSQVGLTMQKISEADENGVAAADDGITLHVAGVHNGLASAESLRQLEFRLQSAKTVDPGISRIGVFTADGSSQLTPHLDFDVLTNSLRIKQQYASTLADLLSHFGLLSISLSLSTSDYEDTYGFEMSVRHAGSQLRLHVLNADNTPATDLAGTRFALRGMEIGYTALATLDDNGEFEVSGLPADTYHVQQVLLQPGIPLIGFAVLPTGSARIELHIRKPQPIDTRRGAPAPAPEIGGWFDGEGTVRQRRRAPKLPAPAAAPPRAASDALHFTATSGPANTLVRRAVHYVVPPESKKA